MKHADGVGVAMPIGESIEPIATIADGDRTWTLALAFDRALLVENDCCRLVGEPREFATTRAALDSLTAVQRAALGLDDARYAALEEVEAARRAIAVGHLDAAGEHVRRCLCDLPAVFAAEPVGEWQIRRPVLSTPQQLARFADRVLADFARAPDEALGRLRQLGALLGVVAREALVSTTTLALPIEVTVRGERVRELPLVPQDARPDRVFPPVDRHAGPTTVVDPLTALYDALMFRCQRIVHLTQLEDVPEGEAEALQPVVDELVAVADARPEVGDAWEYTTTRHDRVPLTYRGSGAGYESASAVLWLDADTIATVRGDTLVTISLATKAIVREYAFGFATVQTCDDAGRFVLVGAEPEDYSGFGIGCLDLHTGEWLHELPSHIPAVTFGYDELGVSTLYAHDREARANGMSALCFARGNRSVLLSSRNDAIAGHGICATATLLSEVSFAPLDACMKRPAPTLHPDGSLSDEPVDVDAMIQERMMMRSHLPYPSAIAGKRFLLPSLHAGDVERTYFRLGFTIDAACFAPDGDRLLVAADELLVIDLPSGAITWRAATPS
jgi:hypothetical protein